MLPQENTEGDLGAGVGGLEKACWEVVPRINPDGNVNYLTQFH